MLFSGLLFVSCEPSEEAVIEAISKTQTGTSQTQSVQPEVSPTIKLLEEIDLREILVGSNQLSNGYYDTTIEYPYYEEGPPLNSLTQRLEIDDEVIGYVLILLYESKFDAEGFLMRKNLL